MAEESSGSRMSWIARYGVPSLILSVAVFVFQQQQQTFDRLQRMLEGGYGFYSNGRTQLAYSEDPGREIALLRIIGNVFPNVFCDVRMDIYLRSTALRIKGGQDAEGRKLLDSGEQKQLWQDLMATSTPTRTPAASNLMEAWTWGRKPTSCESDDRSSIVAQARLKSAAPTDVAAGDGGAPPTAAAAPPPVPAPESAATPTDDAKVAEATPAPSAPGAASTGATKPSGAGAASGPATSTPSPPPPVSAVSAPDIRKAEDDVRVFYHMPSNSKDEREAYLVDATRGYLTEHGYQVVRSIERVAPGSFPKQAQVRYFGSQQADEAEQLVRYLNWYFRDEGLKFGIKAIGKDFPVMPQGNIEVWVPSPASWLKSES
ncbi:MAG TPA: hypothetical protein VGO52_05640 [Hyphomonadaceae bacterium]|nr:hypothetical protein [Hyphomonadaceae bacterium]